MPNNVLKYIPTDHRLSCTKIAEMIIQLVNRPHTHKKVKVDNSSDSLGFESKMDTLSHPHKEENKESLKDMEVIGSSSGFACPICHGVLWEINDEALLRFRCRVGHAFGAESLTLALEEEVESTLWAALRNLAEKADLAKKLAEIVKSRGLENADLFAEKAKRAKLHKEILQNMLISFGKTS